MCPYQPDTVRIPRAVMEQGIANVVEALLAEVGYYLDEASGRGADQQVSSSKPSQVWTRDALMAERYLSSQAPPSKTLCKGRCNGLTPIISRCVAKLNDYLLPYTFRLRTRSRIMADDATFYAPICRTWSFWRYRCLSNVSSSHAREYSDS